MRRTFVIAVAALVISGCALVHYHRTSNPYSRPPFYSKYLNPAVPLDQRIVRDVELLRANPNDAALHNDLGQALQQKGFPKDAETEFERAVNADAHEYHAWYNLGLMRSARGDFMGSRIAFRRAVHYKPGYSEALFQMGLVEEKAGDIDAAIDYYAKAFLINHDLLYAKTNPQIVDSKVVDRALLKAYPKEHARDAAMFQAAPRGGTIPLQPSAVSPVATPEQIVTPAPAVPDQTRVGPPDQTATPAPAPAGVRPRRPRRNAPAVIPPPPSPAAQPPVTGTQPVTTTQPPATST